jgi:CBS domain-containing protein
MRVKELMSQPVRLCSVTQSLDEAAHVMWEGDCGVVPIVDEDGRLVGVVTDRDICMAAHFHGTSLRDIPIVEVMTRDVYACGPDDDLTEAEQLMSMRQVHRLPVVGRDRAPVGLLSMTDVVQVVKPGSTLQKPGSATEECLRTLAAISEPRSKLQATRAN